MNIIQISKATLTSNLSYHMLLFMHTIVSLSCQKSFSPAQIYPPTKWYVLLSYSPITSEHKARVLVQPICYLTNQDIYLFCLILALTIKLMLGLSCQISLAKQYPCMLQIVCSFASAPLYSTSTLSPIHLPLLAIGNPITTLNNSNLSFYQQYHRDPTYSSDQQEPFTHPLPAQLLRTGFINLILYQL